MFLKSAAVIVALTLISMALLDSRHRRLELVYQMAMLHREMDHARKSMWDVQTRIAHLLQPGSLEEAIKKAELKLEPVQNSPVQGPSSQAPSAVNLSARTLSRLSREAPTALTNPLTNRSTHPSFAGATR